MQPVFFVPPCGLQIESKIQDPGFARNHRAIAAGFTFVTGKIADILVS